MSHQEKQLNKKKSIYFDYIKHQRKGDSEPPFLITKAPYKKREEKEKENVKNKFMIFFPNIPKGCEANSQLDWKLNENLSVYNSSAFPPWVDWAKARRLHDDDRVSPWVSQKEKS